MKKLQNLTYSYFLILLLPAYVNGMDLIPFSQYSSTNLTPEQQNDLKKMVAAQAFSPFLGQADDNKVNKEHVSHSHNPAQPEAVPELPALIPSNHKKTNPKKRKYIEKTRKHVCQTCGNSFQQKGGLINHERIHTGEKPFGCQTCPKRFTQKCNLIRHLQVHNRNSTVTYPTRVRKKNET